MPEETNENTGAETKKKSPLVKIGVAAGAVAVVAVTVIAMFATHSICFHEWNEASCTVPKTCSICGATEGEPLGHEPGLWKTVTEATCTAVGERQTTCARCGKEVTDEIPMTEHTPGKWAVAEEYRIESDGSVTPGKEIQTCSVCGGEIDSREYTVELTTGQKNAVIAAYEQVNFWHPSPDYLEHDILMKLEGFTQSDASFAVEHVDIDWDEQALLCAKQNAEGQSKAGLKEWLRYMKFSEKQIEAALKEVGY